MLGVPAVLLCSVVALTRDPNRTLATIALIIGLIEAGVLAGMMLNLF